MKQVHCPSTINLHNHEQQEETVFFSIPRVSRWQRLLVLTAIAATALALLLVALNITDVQANANAQTQPNLTLTKTVEAPADPVRAGDIVTYTIELAYSGGERPLTTFFTDTLPVGVRPSARPRIASSPPNGARPLRVQRRGRTIGWRGELRPESTLIVRVPVRVERCYGADRPITNEASTVRPDNVAISDSASFTVDCADASVRDIDVTRTVIDAGGNELVSGSELVASQINSLSSGLLGTRPFRLRVQMTNRGDSPLTAGVDLNWIGCLTCTVVAADVAEIEEDAPSHYTSIVPLGPGETRRFEQVVNPARILFALPDQPFAPQAIRNEMRLCLLLDDERGCPTPLAAPDRSLDLEQLEVPIRANDLGDAPDSSNHLAANMTAFPGVQASYPTVFDPATGLPPGPLHRHPRPFHLGRRVSLEAEADAGPDQEPLHNIEPGADDPDNDRADDGVRPNFTPCEKGTLDIVVFISAAAQARLLEADNTAFFNAWTDDNRDGDWADVSECPEGRAPEHIVIDHAIDVASLAVGPNTISVPTTGPVAWNQQRPTWLRSTLSEARSVKLPSEEYGDGRGPERGYLTGETEDYLLQPGGGADAAINIEIAYQPNRRVRGIDQSTPLLMRIGYTNLGDAAAQNAVINFPIPAALRDGEIILLAAPGLEPDQYVATDDLWQFKLGDLRPHDFGPIILGWTGCLTCTVTSANVGADVATPAQQVEVSASIRAENDINPDNNQDSATLRRPRRQPTVATRVDASSPWRNGGPTCRDSVNFAGNGEPNASLLLTIQSLDAVGSHDDIVTSAGALSHGRQPLTATVQIDGAGLWQHEQSGLGNGRFRVMAGYVADEVADEVAAADVSAVRCLTCTIAAQLDLLIDTSLPLDPMSLELTDSSGRLYTPLGGNGGDKLGNFEIQELVLRPGDYDARIRSCPGAAVESVQFGVGDGLIDATQAADDCTPRGSDACGPWSARISVPGALNAASANQADLPFAVVAITGDAETTLAGSIQAPESGTVVDALTNQPLVDATVTLLTAGPLNAAWNGAAYGVPNPQATDASGSYSFNAPENTYSLLLERAGYQAHRTPEFSSDGVVAQNASLLPVVDAEPTHTVALSELGFAPGALSVQPGSVVEFVNVDVESHRVYGGGLDGGVLLSGERFIVQFDAVGDVRLLDGSGTLVLNVDPSAPDPGDGGDEPSDDEDSSIFLPVVIN